MRKDALSKQQEIQHAAQEAQQMVADAGIPSTTTTAAAADGTAQPMTIEAAPTTAAATTVPPQQQQQQAAAPVSSKVASAPGQLPLGWAAAKDAQNRAYYYHTQTKKVQWQLPTEDTPIS